LSCANKRLQIEDFPHPLPPMIARFFFAPIGRFDVSRAKVECISLEMCSSPSDDGIDDDDEKNSALGRLLLFSEQKTRQEGEKRRELGAQVKVVMVLLIYSA
tara:strand:- start:821 stop:1126 length:306 start_codon:yes stop_codon:yes gene_type:complete